MKREGFKKSKCTIHGHNECGICSGNHKGKGGVKNDVKKEIETELVEYEQDCKIIPITDYDEIMEKNKRKEIIDLIIKNTKSF